MNDRVALPLNDALEEVKEPRDLGQLLERPVTARRRSVPRARIDGILVGQLVGFRDLCVPLVVFPEQPGTAALDARTTIDLRGEHIGSDVVLVFEECDPQRPIVIGHLRKTTAWPLAEKPAQVDVDADGRRLVLDAKEQVVLKCGKASITLTAGGKVLIQGSYVLSRSSGANRLKGASVQLN